MRRGSNGKGRAKYGNNPGVQMTANKLGLANQGNENMNYRQDQSNLRGQARDMAQMKENRYNQIHHDYDEEDDEDNYNYHKPQKRFIIED